MEIGLVASVIQVAGAGLKLSETLYKYAEAVSTADRRLRDVAQHVRLTSFVIQELGQVFKRDDTAHMITQNAVSTANEALAECRSLFDEMQGTLDKSKKGIFGKLVLPFKELKLELLKANLERLKSTLQLLMQVLTYAQVIATQKFDQKAADEQRQQIASLLQAKEEAERRYKESRQKYDTLLRTVSPMKHGLGFRRSGANAQSIQNPGPNVESENVPGQSRDMSPTMDSRRPSTSEIQAAPVRLSTFSTLADEVPTTIPERTISSVGRDVSGSAAEDTVSSNKSTNSNVAGTSNTAASRVESEIGVAAQARFSARELDACVRHIHSLLEQIEKLQLQLEATPNPSCHNKSHLLGLQRHERYLMRRYAETRRFLDGFFDPDNVDLDTVAVQETIVDDPKANNLIETQGEGIACLQLATPKVDVEIATPRVHLDTSMCMARARRRRPWNIVSGLWEAVSQTPPFRRRRRKAAIEQAERYSSNPYRDSELPTIPVPPTQGHHPPPPQGGRAPSPDWFEPTPRVSQSAEVESRKMVADMAHAADMDYYSRGDEPHAYPKDAEYPASHVSDLDSRSSGASTPVYGMAPSSPLLTPFYPPQDVPKVSVLAAEAEVPTSVPESAHQEIPGGDAVPLGSLFPSATVQQSALPSPRSGPDKVDALLVQWTRLYEQ